MNIDKPTIFGVVVFIILLIIDDVQVRDKLQVYKLTCVQVDLSRSSELTNAIVLQFKKP